jgi:hypothetical protein
MAGLFHPAEYEASDRAAELLLVTHVLSVIIRTVQIPHKKLF